MTISFTLHQLIWAIMIGWPIIMLIACRINRRHTLCAFGWPDVEYGLPGFLLVLGTPVVWLIGFAALYFTK